MWAAVEIPMRLDEVEQESGLMKIELFKPLSGIMSSAYLTSGKSTRRALGKNESGKRATEQCGDFAHRCSPGAPAPWGHAPGQSQSSKKAGHLPGSLSSCRRSRVKPQSPWNILRKNSSTLGLWVFITGSSTRWPPFLKEIKTLSS